LESLRFVACARPACGQIFFVCLRCDRGHRYCGAACSREARRTSLLAAGRRYQSSLDGRVTHAARQARYRGRLRSNVTHHGPSEAPPSAMVRLSPATSATEAPPAMEVTHAPRARPRLCCAFCGVAGRFVRHATLARAGRPQQFRRLRAGGPP
jgi:hypothetical protein